MSAQAGNAIGGAAREKYWEEATADDKIERLRDEVARLCAVVTLQAELLARIGGHSHGADGKLLVPLMEQSNLNRVGLFAHDNGTPHRLRKERERR